MRGLPLGTSDRPAWLIGEFIGSDILINNAGVIRPRPGGFLSLTDEDWMWGLNMSFLVAVRTTCAALQHLLDHGAGTNVNTCSVHAVQPKPPVIDT